MEQYIIKGGNPLVGEVVIGGAKNAALGILAAAIMTDGECLIDNMPNVRDTNVLLQAMEGIGATIDRKGDNEVVISGKNIDSTGDLIVDNEYIRKIRASYYLIGALLGKYRKAQVVLPGGCDIGSRPIDQHIKGFRALGAEVKIEHGMIIAQAEQEITVYEPKNVIIVEMMGRHAGWLTAAAALAEGKNGNVPYLVYLEEKPFSLDRFIDDVKEKLASTNAVLVAVSEGVHDTEGRFLCEQEESRELDVFGHTKLSGTGKILEEAVRAKIGCKVRSIELNLLQRCAGHILSKTDIEESGNLGANAVKLAVAGESGLMSSLTRVSDAPYTVEYSGVDIREVANKEKKIPVEWINEAGNGVKEELITYLTPLVQGEVSSIYENGMPSYLLLK